MQANRLEMISSLSVCLSVHLSLPSVLDILVLVCLSRCHSCSITLSCNLENNSVGRLLEDVYFFVSVSCISFRVQVFTSCSFNVFFCVVQTYILSIESPVLSPSMCKQRLALLFS